ncbi:POTRA domain-containing protein [Lutibacter sp.]|uniref:POTRA domain-containing protein n=1 Tax=Lutibacter sp. TaxID=1925666 RepID=UPI001A2A016F|nr:POTRA domain-containing protein [Lutibacter sp.]MBI9040623.1 hypothetical protein [Lutibacter sp.]
MKSLLKPVLFCVLFIYWSPKIIAQQFELKIHSTDSIQNNEFEGVLYNNKPTSKKEALSEVKMFSEKLHKLGYLHNKYSFTQLDSIFIAEFSLGTKIEFTRIYYKENVDPNFLKKITSSFNATYFEIPFSQTEATINSIVNYFEENGNSFTEVSLINQTILTNILTTELSINQSKERTIDRIVVKGYDEFPEKYFKNHFELKPKSTFNINTLNKLNQQLSNLSFVTKIKAPEVLFTKDSTLVYVYLKKKSNNKFDGILGFSNNKNSNNLQLTGNINIALNNTFNKGEVLTLSWKSSVNENISFESSFFTPYIYNSKLSPFLNFSIIKQDSTFTNVKASIKLNYQINKSHSFNALIRNENSSTISANNTTTIKNFKKSIIGISYAFNTKNYNSPLALEFGYLIGSRKTDATTINQKNIELLGNYTLSLTTKSSLLLKLQSELLFSKNILENELFRIGGVNSIRGFDELAILASKYSIINFEYQYQLNDSSKIYTITDVGYLENSIINQTSKIYSVGIGYFFITEKSRTNLSYALGKNSKTPFKLNNSKIHLKITYFF